MKARSLSVLITVVGTLIAYASGAHADYIVSTGNPEIVNGNLTIPLTSAGGGSADIGINNADGCAAGYGCNGTVYLFGVYSGEIPGTSIATQLSAGTIIGGDQPLPSSWVYEPYIAAARLKNIGCPFCSEFYNDYNENVGDSVFIPFEFIVGTTTDYGWLNLAVSDGPYSDGADYAVTLLGYGYSTNGEDIIIGGGSPVPAPGAMALLSLGLAALLCLSAMRRHPI